MIRINIYEYIDSGKVAIVVAGDTYDVTVRIAYMNSNTFPRRIFIYETNCMPEPTTQSDFTTEIIHTITEVDAGHDCYTTPDAPSDIVAGTNATIQLEYISTYNGSKNQTFYACADIVSNFHANYL